MSRKPKKKPSFIKVLCEMDFTNLLQLPPDFSQKYVSVLPENVKLRVSSERTWDVKIEQMEKGLFCFTQGWKNFVGDVALKFGEFLVFVFDGESLFDVSVYETSACEREFPARSFQAEDSDPDDDDDDELIRDECKPNNQNGSDVIRKRRSEAWNDGGTSKLDQSLEGSNPLYFEILLKPHQRSRITLTKRFWTAAGLMGKKAVGLEYVSKHNYQSVVLDHRPNSYRIDMAGGWPEFRRTNGLAYWKTYSFEFEPSKNVIQVKEVEKGN